MRAIYFEETGGIEKLKLGEVESSTAAIQSAQIKLRPIAGSLNHLDLWVLNGLPRVKYKFPHIVGADCVAIVMESHSSHFKEGDRVLLYPAESSCPEGLPENLSSDFRIRGENTSGVFCEEVIVSDRYARPCPSQLKDEEAAAIPLAFLTAWQMITEKAGIFPGRTKMDDLGSILIYGAGSGVTHSLLQILLSFGVSQIALCSREEEKLHPWKERGLKCYMVSDELESQLKRDFPERFSFIFDHVGERFMPMSIRLMKNGAKLVSCGASSGAEVKIDWRHLYFRQLQLLGSTMGSLRHFYEVISWIQESKIRPLLSSVHPAENFSQAFDEMKYGRQNGKIILSLF